MASESLHRDIFAALVNEAEEIHKGPDVFWRNPGPAINELCILRRWNSHTPSVADVLGGGYFLRWQGKGTIIDPGCSFLRLFRHCTRYSFHDIDMVIVTHDHVDHCQDLGTLVSLFRQFNKWLVKKRGEAPRIWDMIVSYGVADQFISLLNHPDNAPFVFWRRVLADRRQKIEGPQDVPGFLKDAEKNGLLNGEAYLHAFLERVSTPLIKRYFYGLEVLPAKHKELLGAATAFGLRFALKQKSNGVASPGKECAAVISGDTAIRDKAALAGDYGDADLLVLHVGGIEKPGDTSSDHLCFQGVVDILDAVAKCSKVPKLVVLTEWGYEFGRLGLNGRTQFTRYVANELNGPRAFKGRFHAAVAGPDGKLPACPDGAIVLLPADIGLRIQLPDLEVFVESERAKGTFLDNREVCAIESGERIDYLPMAVRSDKGRHE
jgi:hypothetical protein